MSFRFAPALLALTCCTLNGAGPARQAHHLVGLGRFSRPAPRAPGLNTKASCGYSSGE